MAKMNLLENLIGGGNWFYKHAKFVRDRFGQFDQVAVGKRQIFSKCAVASQYSQDCTIRTMTSHIGQTWIATAACGVDFANDPSAGRSVGRAADNFANKLVPGNAAIGHITLGQFEVSPANSGHSDTDETFACGRNWSWIIVAKDRSRLKNKCAHGYATRWKRLMRLAGCKRR